MTDQPGHERPGDTVPHQDKIEELIEEHTSDDNDGLQSLNVIGPFEVNWDDDNLETTGVELAELAEGSIVIRAWAFLVTAWNTNSTVTLNLLAGPNLAEGLYASIYDASFVNTPNIESGLGGLSGFPAVVVNVPDGGVLAAQVAQTGDPSTQGQAFAYALVYTPS